MSKRVFQNRPVLSAVMGLAMLATVLPSHAQAQYYDKAFNAAANYCMDFATRKTPTPNALGKAGFELSNNTKKKLFKGAVRTRELSVVLSAFSGRVPHCTVSVSSLARGDAALAPAVISLMSWANKRPRSIAAQKKGYMTVSEGSDFVGVKMERGMFRGHGSASFRFRLERK